MRKALHAFILFHMLAFSFTVLRPYVPAKYVALAKPFVWPYLASIYGLASYAYFSTNTGNAVALNVKTKPYSDQPTENSAQQDADEIWSQDRSRSQMPMTFVRLQSFANRFSIPRHQQIQLLTSLMRFHCAEKHAETIMISRTFQRTLTQEEFRRGISPIDPVAFSYPEVLLQRKCRI